MLAPQRVAPPFLVLWWVDSMTSCCQPSEHWRPTPEETTVRFLRDETVRALEALEKAERAEDRSHEEALPHLQDARRSLLRLRDCFLPLLRARAWGYEAHRLLDEGHPERSDQALAAVEEILLGMGTEDRPGVEREPRLPRATLTQARTALRARSEEAHESIDKLGAQINLLELKADLALRGTSLERP